VLLGVGCCLKLYPGLFVVPLAWYAATSRPRRRDRRAALSVMVAAVLTVALVNAPFVLFGYRGWLASFAYQRDREADITSNSVWYWGLRPLFGSGDAGQYAFDRLVDIASPTTMIASFVVALWLGLRRCRGGSGGYPWIGVGAAMLCGFVVFNKVHSPQYTLWLLPLVVLLAVPRWLIAAFLVTDLALGVGVFRYYDALAAHAHVPLTEAIVRFGVWGQAAVLICLFGAFLRAEPVRLAHTDAVRGADAGRQQHAAPGHQPVGEAGDRLHGHVRAVVGQRDDVGQGGVGEREG
jgi:hypothetical protein